MVVRRYNKKGNPYYFNKSKGKITSHKAWRISLSYRTPKPSYRIRKVDGRTVKVRLGKVRKGISYQKVYSLKKQRSRLYAKRAYWNKKLSTDIARGAKPKIINASKRELSKITSEIVSINRKLGVVTIIKKKPKKKRQYKENERIYTLTHWEGSNELDEALKKGFVRKYIIEDVTYNKKLPADIRLAYDAMVQKGLRHTKTPYVEFTYQDVARILIIKMY